MDEESVCIGDIVRLGSSRLQVSQPGQLDQLSFLRSAEKAFAVAARHTKRTGWYYRVLEPGWITAGDRAVLIKRLNPSWSVTRFNNIIGGKDPTRKEFAELTDYADSRQSGGGPPKSVTQHERVRVVS